MITCFKIYFDNNRTLEPKTIYHRIFGAKLRDYILEKAQNSKIQNAVSFRATAGYLFYSKLGYFPFESEKDDYPICIELIDDRDKLENFVTSYLKGFQNLLVIESKFNLIQDS